MCCSDLVVTCSDLRSLHVVTYEIPCPRLVKVAVMCQKVRILSGDTWHSVVCKKKHVLELHCMLYHQSTQQGVLWLQHQTLVAPKTKYGAIFKKLELRPQTFDRCAVFFLARYSYLVTGKIIQNSSNVQILK